MNKFKDEIMLGVRILDQFVNEEGNEEEKSAWDLLYKRYRAKLERIQRAEKLLELVCIAFKNEVMQGDGFKDGDYQLFNRAMRFLDDSFEPNIEFKNKS